MTKVYHLARPSAVTTPTNVPQRDIQRPASPDPIHLHAQAENALSMALYYLRQPRCNVMGASRKAVMALQALHQLVQRPDLPGDTVTTTSGRA